MNVKPILPPAMLGILGGGQLGRMFTMAARQMGYQVTVLDPDPLSPAGSVATVHLCKPYLDAEALETLANTCAAVTTEFENVPSDALKQLAQHILVSPSADCVAVAQDRVREKRFISACGLATATYTIVEKLEDLGTQAQNCLPGILKSARMGYDGKGQARVKTLQEAQEAFKQMGERPCVLEKLVALKAEISIVLARSQEGELAFFPLAENEHTNGILDISIVPARVSEKLMDKAKLMATRLANELRYVGVLAIEFFVLEDDRLLINEMAPRPHNSGHFTLDATFSSQFEQQVRAMCHLPLADSRLLQPAVMVNILGDSWKNNEAPDWLAVLANPQAKLHLYGKHEARVGRKMGHFTVLADQVDDAIEHALALKKAL